MNLNYIIYRLKWYLADYINFNSPIHLDLELNNNCNQSCISCWHHDPKTRKFHIRSISKPIAYSILHLAKDAGILSIKFNLRGEPLLYKDLCDIISYANKLKFIDLMINTNGVLLDMQMIEHLNRAGLTTLIISVDSFDAKTYCKIHNCGQDDYKQLIANLEILTTMYRNKFLQFKTILNFHENKYNCNEKINLSHKYFEFMKPVFRKTEKREGKDISIRWDRDKRKTHCPHMRRRITITAGLEIYPCCVCYNELGDIKLGDIGMLNIRTAWKSKRRKQLMKVYSQGIYSYSCQICTSGDIWMQRSDV